MRPGTIGFNILCRTVPAYLVPGPVVHFNNIFLFLLVAKWTTQPKSRASSTSLSRSCSRAVWIRHKTCCKSWGVKVKKTVHWPGNFLISFAAALRSVWIFGSFSRKVVWFSVVAVCLRYWTTEDIRSRSLQGRNVSLNLTNTKINCEFLSIGRSGDGKAIAYI